MLMRCTGYSKNNQFIYFFFKPEDPARAFEKMCTRKEAHGHLFVQESIRTAGSELRNLFIPWSLLAR